MFASSGGPTTLPMASTTTANSSNTSSMQPPPQQQPHHHPQPTRRRPRPTSPPLLAPPLPHLATAIAPSSTSSSLSVWNQETVPRRKKTVRFGRGTTSTTMTMTTTTTTRRRLVPPLYQILIVAWVTLMSMALVAVSRWSLLRSSNSSTTVPTLDAMRRLELISPTTTTQRTTITMDTSTTTTTSASIPNTEVVLNETTDKNNKNNNDNKSILQPSVTNMNHDMGDHQQSLPIVSNVVNESSILLHNNDNNIDNHNETLTLSMRYPLDYEYYTVRINTWKRQEQLQIVLHHLLTCPTVTQIQVVWCSAQGPVPDWLHQLKKGAGRHPQHHQTNDYHHTENGSLYFLDWPRLVVEEHEDNSLNARFDVLLPPPTAGILNQDDDVLRPCAAMDAGFALWTMNPERLVGFDARRVGIQSEDEDQSDKKHSNKSDKNKENHKPTTTTTTWTYGALSQSKKYNDYSLVLTRFAFCHVTYLHSYTHDARTAPMRHFVAHNLNCEDVALSLWITAWTNGTLPLLADGWALATQIKLPTTSAISKNTGDHGAAAAGGSTSKSHKELRNTCVDQFATLLQLKPSREEEDNDHDQVNGRLQPGRTAEWMHYQQSQQPQQQSKSKQPQHRHGTNNFLLQCGVEGRDSHDLFVHWNMGTLARRLLQQRQDWKLWSKNDMYHRLVEPLKQHVWRQVQARHYDNNNNHNAQPRVPAVAVVAAKVIA